MPKTPPRRRWLLAIGALAVVLVGLERPSLVLVPEPAVAVTPLFQRVEVGPTEQVQRTLTIRAARELTLLAVESGCRCVALTTPLPLVMKAGTTEVIALTVNGALPGMKGLTLRTTAGSVSMQVQIISAGLGDGLTGWQAVTRKAVAQQRTLVAIVHDLHGEIRNCGCSGGSLGGIDHLAALPAALALWAPGLHVRFVLSGDADGHRTGVAAALAAYGWQRDPTIVVSANPVRDVQDASLLAVIPAQPTTLNHRKLIVPVLNGGMTAEVLQVDAQGQIVEQETLPIDATLPSDPALVARFPDQLSVRIDDSRVPSQDCLGCHAAAHQTWLASRHAQAWTSLKPGDRTDGCIACHSTALAQPAVVAPGVQCQSCHSGAAAHALAPTTVRTGGTSDCRSCHDARHDPGFDPVRAWARIAHGK